MRCRLSPTADVPSHTSRAAMCPLADIAPTGARNCVGTRIPLPKCIVPLPWRPARSSLRACPSGRAPLTAPRPSELHHQIGGHHADDFSLAAASRRRCDAGRLVCTVRRWRRPDRQHRHRRRYRAAARRRCRRLSWVGVGRRNRRHAALGPDTHGGAASGNAGRLAGGRFRRQRFAAVGGARRRDIQDHDRERAGAVVFQSRAPAHLRVQSQRGAACLPQGAEARS